MNKKHLFRLLGLSMLVAVTAMAVSASAAQAKWLVLLDGKSVSTIKLGISAPKGELLVPGLGLAIVCEGGTGSVSASLSNENKTLSGSASIIFSGCTDLNFGEVCDVSSIGDAAGTIKSGGEGAAGMEGEEYFVDASSSEFTNITYTGEECPLTEIDGRVNGKVRVTLLDALKDTNLKVGHVLVPPKSLFFGEEEATLHDTSGKPLLISFSHSPEKTWAIHLEGL